MVTTLVQVGRTAARPLGMMVEVGRRRSLRGVVGLVLIVVTVRAWAGVWPAALLGAVVVTAGLLAGWAAVERRVTERVRARPLVARRPRRVEIEAGHVAFARGLAGLAAWYLAECEREAQQ